MINLLFCVIQALFVVSKAIGIYEVSWWIVFVPAYILAFIKLLQLVLYSILIFLNGDDDEKDAKFE